MGQINHAPVVSIAKMSLNVILENKNLAKNSELTITKKTTKKTIDAQRLAIVPQKTLLCMAYYFS